MKTFQQFMLLVLWLDFLWRLRRWILEPAVPMLWRLWCWLVGICPECEQTWRMPGKHYPVSRCEKKPLADSGGEGGA